MLVKPTSGVLYYHFFAPECIIFRGTCICKSKSRTIVEYALKTTTVPIGVATYTLSQDLPEDYRGLLPAPEVIVRKLQALLEEWYKIIGVR